MIVEWMQVLYGTTFEFKNQKSHTALEVPPSFFLIPLFFPHKKIPRFLMGLILISIYFLQFLSIQVVTRNMVFDAVFYVL